MGSSAVILVHDYRIIYIYTLQITKSTYFFDDRYIKNQAADTEYTNKINAIVTKYSA